MNDENTTEPKADESAESAETKPEVQQATCCGIVGNSTNHDMVMTRLWISEDNIIENVEIKVIGLNFTKDIATRATKHLRGKGIADFEFIADFDPEGDFCKDCVNLNIVYESIIHALADFHKPHETPVESEPEVKVQSGDDSSEEKPVEETGA